MTSTLRLNRFILPLILLASSLFIHGERASATDASGAKSIESYVGVVVGPRERLPRTFSSLLTVRIERFTTEQESEKIAAMLAKNQFEALRTWPKDGPIGTLQLGDRLPDPIAAAWSYDDEHGRHIVVVVPRTLSIREIFQGRRSVQYPYTVAQLDLEEDGHGSGELVAAARLRLGEDGGIEYNPLGVIPLRILGLRPLGD